MTKFQFDRLNPRQKEAVLVESGPALVLAGAGSGKTRVLTQRMIYLMQEHRVSPWNILAVTFTNKAAKEMKARVVNDIGPMANDLWISTFHSTCLRILRRHADKIGFENQFAIYDTTDQKNIMKSLIKEMGLSDQNFKPQAVLRHIDQAKNKGVTCADFVTEGDFYLEKIKELYTLYQKELKRNQAMDFGDLILNVLVLFKSNPEVLAFYQNQFQHIMVDEYQDTNAVQYTLIRLLAHKYKNVFVVGDDDQSIYKFRGAEIQNILNFQKDYPEAIVVRLEQNYRSTMNILKASNAVIKKNTTRMGKELWTEKEAGDPILVYNALDEKDEARFVAGQIKTLQEEYSLSDMAVFYRTNSQSRSIEDELRKNRIAYKIVGGMKFYDRAEIKDIMAYLRLLVNPSDGVGFKRVVNVPTRGIGKTTIGKIEECAQRNDLSMWNVLREIDNPQFMLKINAGTRTKLKSFVAILEKVQKARQELSLSEFITYLYEQTGYWQMLTADKSFEAEGRKENLSELVNVVEEYEQSQPDASLEGFLDQIALASDLDNLEEEQNYVTLMTVHLSKGLEFPVVMIAGMEEGLFPHNRSLDSEDDIEEERRLCYVAMTRAQEKLYVSYANERKVFGSSSYNFPSRFLEDIPSDVLDTAIGSTLSSSNEDDDYSFGIPESVRKRLVQKAQQGSSGQTRNSGFSQNQSRSQQSYSSRKKSSYGSQKPSTIRRRPKDENLKTVDRHSGVVVDTSYSQENVGIRKGQKVRHGIFGSGVIQSFEGMGDSLKVSVKFQNGIQKKLVLKHANLQFV